MIFGGAGRLSLLAFASCVSLGKAATLFTDETVIGWDFSANYLDVILVHIPYLVKKFPRGPVLEYRQD